MNFFNLCTPTSDIWDKHYLEHCVLFFCIPLMNMSVENIFKGFKKNYALKKQDQCLLANSDDKGHKKH